MFDISFGELLLIGVVALVVLGPERLPVVAKTLGALVARAQRFVASVKADIQAQTDLTGLTALRQDMQETAYALKSQLEAELHSVRDELTVPPIPSAQADPLHETPVSAAVPAEPAIAAAVHDDNQLDLFSDLAPPSPHEKHQ